MNILKNLSLLGACVALSSCAAIEGLHKPLTDDGYSPLDRAGTKRKDGLVPVGSSSNNGNVGLATGHGFKSGDIVEVAIANTALFKRVPKPGDRYSKVR